MEIEMTFWAWICSCIPQLLQRPSSGLERHTQDPLLGVEFRAHVCADGRYGGGIPLESNRGLLSNHINIITFGDSKLFDIIQMPTSLSESASLKVNITSSISLSLSQQQFAIVTRKRAKKSSMFDYQLELYKLSDLQLVRRTGIYSTYSENKHHCQFTHNDEMIVVATESHVIFYDASSLETLKKMLHQQDNFYDLCTSVNGQMVGVVGDSRILLWDTLTFASIKFPFELSLARTCRFSMDNRFIAVSTTLTVSVYEIVPFGGSYIFELRYKTPQEISFGMVSSFDFSPSKALRIVIGFSNASPRVYDFEEDSLGFQKIYEKGEQPSYFNNHKIVAFLPDGQRVVSSDYTEGMGIWPADPSQDLFYKQDYLFFGLQPFDHGRKVLGFVWQRIKIVQINIDCPQGTKQFNDGKNHTSCSCLSSNSFWNPSTSLCEPCVKNGKSICSCPPGYQFVGESLRCMIQCSIIEHALPQNSYPFHELNPVTNEELWSEKCFCSRGYFWQQGKCIFDCYQIQFALQPDESSSSSCVCIYPFTWNDQTKQCQCPLFSIFSPFGQMFCECDEFHYMDLVTRSCLPDCTLIQNADLMNITLSSDVTRCQCQQGFQFIVYDLPGSGHVTEGCLRNCNQVQNSLGTIGIENCLCNEITVWNSLSSLCEIQCSLIKNAIKDPVQSVGNISSLKNSCKCAINYMWVSENNECGRDCTNVKYVNKQEYSTSISCPCSKNFYWDYYKSQCLIDCENINYTQPYTIGVGDQCFCRQNYVWEKNITACAINCSEVWDAEKERIGLGECQCKDGKEFDSTTLICKAITDERVFQNIWIIVFLVFVSIFTILVAIVMIKLCCKFATKNNLEHEKRLKVKSSDSKKKKRKAKNDGKEDEKNTERVRLK